MSTCPRPPGRVTNVHVLEVSSTRLSQLTLHRERRASRLRVTGFLFFLVAVENFDILITSSFNENETFS